jgi:hypothetical protein
MTSAKPVAIIAIHGVGDQAPCETARNLAQHLLRVESIEASDSATNATYSAFEEHSIVLPVLPIKSELNLAPPASDKSIHMSSSSEFLRAKGAASPADTVDTDFTRSLINEYDGRTAPHGYHTLMLEGTRREAGKPDQAIHIYEMYWGDLSRLGSGLLAVLGELYQLLLHAGSIARVTADLQWAAAKRNNVAAPLLPLLAIFRWMVGSTIWLSTVPLVAVNFVLVAVALTIVPLTIPFIASSAYVGYAGLAMSCAVLVALFFVLQIYDARRTGSMKWGMGVAAVAVMVALWRFSKYDHLQTIALAHETIVLRYQTIALSVSEVIFHLLWPLALLILKLIVLLLLLAILCVAFKRQAKPRAATIPQGIITAITSVIVPLASSCVITVLLWSGSAFFLKSALNAKAAFISVMPGWIDMLPKSLQPSKWLANANGDDSQVAFIDYLQDHAGSETFNWMLIGMVIGFLLLVAGTLWSIKDELWAPSGAVSSNDKKIAFGGKWLNAGLTKIAFLALAVIITFAAIAMLIPIFGYCSPDDKGLLCKNDLVRYFGLAITGSSAGLLALGKAYTRGLGALRPGLDLALDVDNWLRERPKKSNPRARILSRYLALLKHLKERGYERVVIVAHSQGTVITADLLRLLKTSNWHDQLNIRLFTLGSPLRQLYAERFPDLYGWVTNLGGPVPAHLHGVTYWLNGYRSGDYVGRALWEDLMSTPRFSAGPLPKTFVSSDLKAAKPYGEFCVGAGAHTHYFDYTAPDVAAAIDLLIAD